MSPNDRPDKIGQVGAYKTLYDNIYEANKTGTFDVKFKGKISVI